MPAQKNKLSFDLADREKKTSAVQRFINDEFSENTEKSETPGTAEIIETPEPPKYMLKNAMEETVIEEAAAALKHMPGACKCGKCFYDICAIVLNALPQQSYSTTGQGELMGRARAVLNFETRAKISNEVFRAIELVKKSPQHDG